MMVQGADGSIAGKTLPKAPRTGLDMDGDNRSPMVKAPVGCTVTREDAFNYIYSIKDHLDIQDSSFIIKYQYKEADIEMVVVEGEVWLLEINPSIPAWLNSRYKDFPIYTQVKGMA